MMIKIVAAAILIPAADITPRQIAVAAPLPVEIMLPDPTLPCFEGCSTTCDVVPDDIPAGIESCISWKCLEVSGGTPGVCVWNHPNCIIQTNCNHTYKLDVTLTACGGTDLTGQVVSQSTTCTDNGSGEAHLITTVSVAACGANIPKKIVFQSGSLCPLGGGTPGGSITVWARCDKCDGYAHK